VCLIIGVSSGIVLWIYGVTGLFPAGAEYAVAFAAWVFFMEFIPYIGPILGAIPPVVLALFESPFIALWVVVAFVAIHQLEGHVVVPQVMGEALGVHPLVVIFGLLVGEQLYGLVGILLSIPVVVILKETLIYGAERLGLAGWQRDEAEMAAGAAPRPPPAPPEPAPAPPEAEREAPTESLGEMPTTGFRSER
jgi:predicted PurR-regulated permease PerM